MKRNLVSTLAVLISAVSIGLPDAASAQSCYPTPTGIAAWWPAQNSAADIISGNQATLSNVRFITGGMVGDCFQFPAQYSAVLVGNPVNLAVQQFTIEAWVQRAALGEVSLDPQGNGHIFGWGS